MDVAFANCTLELESPQPFTADGDALSVRLAGELGSDIASGWLFQCDNAGSDLVVAASTPVDPAPALSGAEVVVTLFDGAVEVSINDTSTKTASGTVNALDPGFPLPFPLPVQLDFTGAVLHARLAVPD
jgi:hypothetical protein